MSKRSQAFSGLAHSSRLHLAVLCTAFVILIGMTGCGQAAAPAPAVSTPAPAEPTQAAPTATATSLPSATPTQAPTATTEPTATLEPTATAVPPLAVLEDGFNAWCAPVEYAGTNPGSLEAPEYANKLTVNGDELQIKIPASSCTVTVRFNQAAPEGAQLVFYDGRSPFLKLPLQPAEGQPEEVWTSVKHTMVIDPPLWDVTYRLAVVAADSQELWTNSVTFAKPTPEACPYGGLPDPVTLWCTVTDPWEIEPKPGVKYPYDRSRFATPIP